MTARRSHKRPSRNARRRLALRLADPNRRRRGRRRRPTDEPRETW